jgi:hypothetical protein
MALADERAQRGGKRIWVHPRRAHPIVQRSDAPGWRGSNITGTNVSDTETTTKTRGYIDLEAGTVTRDTETYSMAGVPEHAQR